MIKCCESLITEKRWGRDTKRERGWLVQNFGKQSKTEHLFKKYLFILVPLIILHLKTTFRYSNCISKQSLGLSSIFHHFHKRITHTLHPRTPFPHASLPLPGPRSPPPMSKVFFFLDLSTFL